MLTYNIREKGDIPAYEFIYKCIKSDILKGTLKADEKLPSKRTLATNLGVSVITVQNGYEQLLYEGYIYALEKKGYYVSNIGETVPYTDASDIISIKNDVEKRDSMISTKNNDLKQKDVFMDFTYNHDTGILFPYTTWARLTRKTLLNRERKMTERVENMGSSELRGAISKYLRESRGLSVKPDNIIIGAGMEYLYGILVQLFGRSKMMVVEDPGHTKVYKIYEANGVKVLHAPMDEEGLKTDILERGNISAVHISPTHHFPTGVITSAVRRHKILELANAQDFYVIEDDYDSEFHFEGRPIPAMANLDANRVIYMNTFSKSLMQSLRIAYMILPDRLMEKYQEKLSFYACTVSGLEQYVLAEFMNGGYFERHINRTRLHYKKCRNQFLECFEKSKLAQISRIDEKGAGLHFILRFEEGAVDCEYERKLRERGILIKSLASYCYRPDDGMKNCFIMNYFQTEEEKLTEAFDVMYNVRR